MSIILGGILLEAQSRIIASVINVEESIHSSIALIGMVFDSSTMDIVGLGEDNVNETQRCYGIK